jgi:hypothetical protein
MPQNTVFQEWTLSQEAVSHPHHLATSTDVLNHFRKVKAFHHMDVHSPRSPPKQVTEIRINSPSHIQWPFQHITQRHSAIPPPPSFCHLSRRIVSRLCSSSFPTCDSLWRRSGGHPNGVWRMMCTAVMATSASITHTEKEKSLSPGLTASLSMCLSLSFSRCDDRNERSCSLSFPIHRTSGRY